jgi:hypothetical protein
MTTIFMMDLRVVMFQLFSESHPAGHGPPPRLPLRAIRHGPTALPDEAHRTGPHSRRSALFVGLLPTPALSTRHGWNHTRPLQWSSEGGRGDRAGVDAAIVGARHAKHVDDSVAAAELRPGRDDLEQIDRIMADSSRCPARRPR